MHLQLAPVRVGQRAEGLLVARPGALERRVVRSSSHVLVLLVHVSHDTGRGPKLIGQFAGGRGVCIAA